LHSVSFDVPGSDIPAPSRGSYPVRPGNRVRPLIDGEVAFRRICEAIEAARYSVWSTVAFMTPDFLMPDGRGSLFDALDGATARGVDVRVIFWRPNPETSQFEPRVFSGTPAQRQMLAARNTGFRIRWHRAAAGYCQHQKSWLIDAGLASEIAFVGGINLNPKSVVPPGHQGAGQHHDAYVEIAGPSASDIHHNFVQRWSQASERVAPDGVWGRDGDDDLAFPVSVSRLQGDSTVQIQRTVRAGRYSTSASAPNGPAFDIAEGETSIFEQYRLAIGAARHAIYIEKPGVGSSGDRGGVE
jgi:cardiolipin synthase A/B